MNSKKLLNTCINCGSICCKILGGADFTKKEMQRIVKSGAPIKFNKVSDNHYEFQTNGKGQCAYLNEKGACGIYNVRPSGCRCWPVEYPDYDKKGKPLFSICDCALVKNLSKKDIEKLKKIARNVTPEISNGCVKNTHLPKKEIDLCVKNYEKTFKMTRIK
jgi:Fe-S-cluster containining protein